MIVEGARGESSMRRLFVLLVACAALSAACGDDTAASTTPTIPSTSTSAATTTAATTSTTTIPATSTSESSSSTTTATTTTAAVGRCGGLASMTIPGDAADLIRVPGSFDGDPQPASIMESDGAILFRSAGAWWIGISLHIDYVVFRQLPSSMDSAFVPEITAVVDFGPLDDGALVKIDHSLAGGDTVYAFYFLDSGCDVREAGTTDVPQLEFLVGGGAAHTEGLTCAVDGVFATTAGQESSGMWDIRDHFYAWDPAGSGFTDGFEDGTEVPDGDPAIAQAGLLDC